MYTVYSHGHFPHLQYFYNIEDAERAKQELIGNGYTAIMENLKKGDK